jgi:hypothetical protein
LRQSAFAFVVAPLLSFRAQPGTCFCFLVAIPSKTHSPTLQALALCQSPAADPRRRTPNTTNPTTASAFSTAFAIGDLAFLFKSSNTMKIRMNIENRGVAILKLESSPHRP